MQEAINQTDFGYQSPVLDFAKLSRSRISMNPELELRLENQTQIINVNDQTLPKMWVWG